MNFDTFMNIRKLAYLSVKDVEGDEWWTIPQGFANNIAWNLGHMVVTQEAVTHRLSGLPTITTDEDMSRFRNGTSPEEWGDWKPDMDRWKGLLRDTSDKLTTDYEAGVFKEYKTLTTSTGFVLNNVDDAIVFNKFHEGLHLGVIISLKDVLRSA